MYYFYILFSFCFYLGGYPNNPGAFPYKPEGMSVSDCLFAQDVSAFPETLCFVFRTDNSGPPEDVNVSHYC